VEARKNVIDIGGEDVSIENIQEEYKQVVSIFPALHKYQKEHSEINLQKLCVEIADFCRAIYASTENEQERQIFFAMLDKLNKK
jgi:hypothetical protein